MPRSLRTALLLLLSVALCGGGARAWDEIMSGAANEASECVSWSKSRIDCFTRTASGSLSWTYSDHGSWSAPRDLGGKLASKPSCIVRGPGGINCFATTAKGVLATIHLNGESWSKWSSLGGDLQPSRPSCVGLARDRIVCFARGRDRQLMARKWNGGRSWEAWRNLGGTLSADPDCIGVNSSSAACFGRGAHGELVAYFTDPAGKKGGWSNLGARIEGKPSCVRLVSGEASCAAQSRSGRLHMWRGMPLYDQNPGIVTSIDDTVADEPACALQAGTHVCFTRDNRGRLVRHSFGSRADTSHDGTLDAPLAVAVTCLSFGSAGLGCVLTDADRNVQFAADNELEADAADEPDDHAGDAALGAWHLSNLGTGDTCRLMLSPDLAFGAKRLRAGSHCRRIGMPVRAVQWEQDGDELSFMAAGGRVLLRFHSTATGRWVAPQRDATLLLTREPPEEIAELKVAAAMNAESDRHSTMFGRWRVFGDDRGLLCTVKLTSARAGEGFAVRADSECQDRFSDVRYWAESGPAIVFVGPANVVVARFDSAGPGAWRSDALGGLILKR
jgi:Protease inhibitor Inh